MAEPRKCVVLTAQHWYDAARKAALAGDYSHALLYFENAFNHTENALASARKALIEIDGWRDDTLGARPREKTEYDCPQEVSEAFDRGCRMAFYRCSSRAREFLQIGAAKETESA